MRARFRVGKESPSFPFGMGCAARFPRETWCVATPPPDGAATGPCAAPSAGTSDASAIRTWKSVANRERISMVISSHYRADVDHTTSVVKNKRGL